jgi:hypothetical protein
LLWARGPFWIFGRPNVAVECDSEYAGYERMVYGAVVATRHADLVQRYHDTWLVRLPAHEAHESGATRGDLAHFLLDGGVNRSQASKDLTDLVGISVGEAVAIVKDEFDRRSEPVDGAGASGPTIP